MGHRARKVTVVALEPRRSRAVEKLGRNGNESLSGKAPCHVANVFIYPVRFLEYQQPRIAVAPARARHVRIHLRAIAYLQRHVGVFYWSYCFLVGHPRLLSSRFVSGRTDRKLYEIF